MKSIIFRGHDFGEICTAKTVLPPSICSIPKTRTIPGRPGALLVSGQMQPTEIKVRLMLRSDRRMDAAELSRTRHMLAAWLAEAGSLVLPEEPDLTYRDCVVTEGVAWDELMEDGACTVTFTVHDPVAYGPLRSVRDLSFTVGGTWATSPVVTVEAVASKTFSISLDGDAILTFLDPTRNGDIVVFDSVAGRVTVNGEVADARMSLTSSFFRMSPGEHALSLRACSLVSCEFHERWL